MCSRNVIVLVCKLVLRYVGRVFFTVYQANLMIITKINRFINSKE